jgi:hypothetical protein
LDSPYSARSGQLLVVLLVIALADTCFEEGTVVSQIAEAIGGLWLVAVIGGLVVAGLAGLMASD